VGRVGAGPGCRGERVVAFVYSERHKSCLPCRSHLMVASNIFRTPQVAFNSGIPYFWDATNIWPETSGVQKKRGTPLT
jgi:hypothetical protein